MKPTDVSLARIPTSEPEVGLDALYTPFIRRWRLVALCILGAWAAALALILIPKREYKAQLVVAAVPNAKSASLAGGISSLLGNATIGGVQSTPYFITRLLMLRGVLREVALSPSPRAPRPRSSSVCWKSREPTIGPGRDGHRHARSCLAPTWTSRRAW